MVNNSANLGCAILLVPLDIRPKIQNCTCAVHYAVIVEVFGVVGTFLATSYCYHVPCDEEHLIKTHVTTKWGIIQSKHFTIGILIANALLAVRIEGVAFMDEHLLKIFLNLIKNYSV